AELAEHRRLLWQIADAAARALVHRFGGDVVAVEHDPALVGRDQADDHVEAGGLAGAVGAEQAHDLAGVEAQLEVAHDLALAVALAQAFGDQHQSFPSSPASRSPVRLRGSNCRVTRPPFSPPPPCTWPVRML